MSHTMPTLSIVTPAYNRGKLLWNCYKSLRKQTSTDFEWIVIDDGSTDGTLDIISCIKKEKQMFDIFYVRKNNGGKHTALNASHPYLRGQYVLILDSDDTLTLDAVKTVLDNWKKYEDNKDIGLLIFQRENKEHTVCAYAKDEYIPVDLLNYQRINVLSSDCCEVLRTELFKKYPFPIYKDEKFMAETALWYRVGLEKKCIYINKPIYVCEYLEDGLTKSGRAMRVKNPKGGMYTSYLRMNKRCRINERIKAALLYVCYSRYAKEKAVKTINRAKKYRMLVIICFIPGVLLYWKWKKIYK